MDSDLPDPEHMSETCARIADVALSAHPQRSLERGMVSEQCRCRQKCSSTACCLLVRHLSVSGEGNEQRAA